jgi:hypothetical protein
MSRTRPRPHQRHLARGIGCALALGLALCAPFAPASAQAAAPFSWSSTAIPGGGTPSAVSCASESLCAAVDEQGDAFVTTDPTASSPSWSFSALDTEGHALTGVSCAPGGPCVAVEEHGDAFVDSQPGSSTWSGPFDIDGTKALSGIACPTALLCVAVDESGDVLSTGSPASSNWPFAEVDPGHSLRSVACPGTSLCVAVDGSGEVLENGGGAWHAQRVDFGELRAVSCASTSACVAVDASGQALASADPGSPTATWSVTPVGDGERLAAASCASSGLCSAVGAGGEALASDNATAPTPDWPAQYVDGQSLTGVSCLPGGFCMAVSTSGDAVAGRVSAPQATTVKPIEVTDAGATLAGVVNPNDAMLGACAFEYGTSVAYVQSVPCAVLPTAVGGARSVSAQISGLEPNTTYHYRVVASSPSGTTVGADEAFTTAVSSLVAIVHPNPSISGTPANGQTLTCHPGTPSGTTAQLTYAWLRDQIPIAGATASTYAVKGQDTGHHLQCQVTATDGGGSATANSAFVTIPVGGVPASAGETAVGKASFRSGKVSVPIGCSTQASGGCRVALRLTAVETLSGGRIVAIAARSSSSAAGLRHVTVTLASVRVHLARGARTTVAATLNATGKRLLSAMRHFSAYAYVTGTVIGVIEAQLAQQLVALSAVPHSTSTHAARRR